MPDKFYAEIFAQSGASYHQAMQRWPRARDQEFQAALSLLSLADHTQVLDVPAGGGYLERYLPDSTHYHGFDFSGGFDRSHNQIINCSESNIELPDASMDAAICLASLHHVEHRNDFYAEIHRILKPNGTFLIGDIVSGSRQDVFLNQFVDRWNKLGHKGIFIEPAPDQKQLSQAGFSTEYSHKHYHWCFEKKDDVAEYFRLLFSLDKQPSHALLSAAIEQLGITNNHTGVDVNWSLGFIKATKPTD